MELYQKQIKYSLFKMVPAYGFNPDGYTDVLVEDTGWILEEKDTWADKDVGPYAAECSFMESVSWYTVAGAPARIKTRWVKREERYVKIDAEPVVHARWIVPDDNYPDTCSNCLFEFVWDGDDDYLPKRCPNCGAKMDGERRDNNG